MNEIERNNDEIKQLKVEIEERKTRISELLKVNLELESGMTIGNIVEFKDGKYGIIRFMNSLGRYWETNLIKKDGTIGRNSRTTYGNGTKAFETYEDFKAMLDNL